MRWSIFNITKQKKNTQDGKGAFGAAPELFLPDLCRMKAVINSGKEVAIYYLSTEEVAFKTDVAIETDQDVPFSITYHRWKPNDVYETLDSAVNINAGGKAEGGTFLYKGQFKPCNDPALERFFDYLRHLSGGKPVEDVQQDADNRRKYFRLDRVLPIMSKDIEGFKALTENISIGGVTLICTGGEVHRGDIIDLRLDLDEYEAIPLNFKAKVCWVVQEDSNKTRVGVEFLDLDEFKRERLSNYIENVQKLFKLINH